MTTRMKGLAVAGEALAASASICAAGAAVWAAGAERPLLAAVAATALVWGAVPTILALLRERAVDRDREPDRLRDRAPDAVVDDPVTVVVRLGDEPIEVAAAAVRAAARWAPTIVLTTDREVPAQLVRGGVVVRRGATPQRALEAALPQITTPAVLITSARAVAREAACREAAALLADGVGWVTGRSEPVDANAFAPVARAERSTEGRRAVRAAGADLWEPDATLLRTALVRQHPPRSGRPWGDWLRERRSEGHRGAVSDELLSLRAAPVGASGFWPDAAGRQRAAAADIAGAVRTGPLRARVASVALLASELYGVQLLLWLAAFGAVASDGTFTARVGAIPALAVAATPAVLRWWFRCRRTGRRPRPVDDVVSCVYHAPASVASLASAVTGRLRPSRFSMPERPLVWVALLLTIATGAGLLGRPAGPVLASTVALTLLLLAALWTLALRALVQRDWARVSFRLALDGEAWIDGVPLRIWDGSPDGVGVVGELPEHVRAPGHEASLRLELAGGVAVQGRAVVASCRRRGHGEHLVGLELRLDDREQARWLEALFDAAGAPGRHHRRVASGPSLPRAPRSWRDRVVVASVAAVSAPVAVALCLVLFGLQPLVIRSGSMRPTFEVGDVVLSRTVPVSAVGPGDVVTVYGTDLTGDSVTHRVESIAPTGEAIRIRTRGDANQLAEEWTVPSDARLGEVVASVPWIGAPATWLRGVALRLSLLAAAAAVLVTALLRRRRAVPLAGGAGSVAGHGADDPPQPELLHVEARDGRGVPPRGRRRRGAVPEEAPRS